MLEGNEQRLDDGKSHYSVATKHYMSLYVLHAFLCPSKTNASEYLETLIVKMLKT